MNFKEIQFKPCNGSKEDFHLLREIHKAAMYDTVIECIGEWDDYFQRERLMLIFKDHHKSLEFIVLNNKEIGTINSRCEKTDSGESHYLEQFYILPAHQGKGLGSYLINEKINQHCADTLLSVLKKDTQTHAFYYKNGFLEYKEDEHQKYMKKLFYK